MVTTKNIPVIAYLTPEQARTLNALSKTTRVPKAVYVREAIDDLFMKYARQVKKGGAK